MIRLTILLFSVSLWSQEGLKKLRSDAEIICKSNTVDLFCKSYSFYQQKKYDSCFLYSSKALLLETEERKKSILHYIQSVVALRKGMNSKALDNIKSMRSYLGLKTMKLGRIYLGLKKYDSAIFFFNKWLDHNEKFDSEYVKTVYHNIALTYLHKKEFTLSKEYFDKELALIKKKDTFSTIRTKINMANAYYVQYKDNIAIPLFREAYELSKKYSDFNLRRDATKNMAVIEKDRKNFEKSLQYFDEYDKLRDSIWDRDNIVELTEKDKQIAVAQKQQEITLQDEELKRQQLVQNGLLVGASGLVVFIGFLGFLYRKLKKQNYLITKQKEDLNLANKTKDYLFSVVSHDLRSPMNTIKSQHIDLSNHIESKNFEGIKKANEAAIVITDSTSHLLNNVLHWSLEQSNQLVFDTKEYALRPLIQHILHDYETLLNAREITVTSELENILADFDKESIKIVLRNLLDNALKYMGGKGQVTIKTGEHSDTKAFIILEDTGQGITKEKLQKINSLKDLSIDKIDRSKGVGLGLLLCQTLVKKNNGSITFESELGKGTKITILLPKVID